MQRLRQAEETIDRPLGSDAFLSELAVTRKGSALTGDYALQHIPSMMHTSNLSPEHLLALLEETIRDTPTFAYNEPLSDAELRWLGSAEAIIEAAGSMSALMDFRVARQNLNSYSHSRHGLLLPLHASYSRVELSVPTSARGAFIPAGDTWNGYAALVKVIQNPCDDLLIVDPYLNSDVFIDFLPLSAARMGVRCLTTKRSENHPGLLAAAGKWAGDALAESKPVEVRYAPPSALHDRLIIVDEKAAWLISQSIKDIAKRSPASVSRAETELGHLKSECYNNLWKLSLPIT